MLRLQRREFLMLAKTYNAKRHSVGGWYVSEKLDGTRVFWDGGISRGQSTIDVPYANTVDPKTGRMKKKIKPFATGLWSRYGNPIMAPDWFLNLLPCIPLDGEIWAGRGNFQLCRSICGGDTPGPYWDQAEFAVFSCPPVDKIFGDGEIRNSNMHLKILKQNVDLWFHKTNVITDFQYLSGDRVTFDIELASLRDAIPSEGRIYLHQQKRLPLNVKEAASAIEQELQRVIDLGGEGLIIRDPDGKWTPKRVGTVLKYKPFHDAEGILIGFTSGRETDKGSRHLGRIGALILDYKGKRLELSGLTDEERAFNDPPDVWWPDSMAAYATQHPGIDMPDWITAKHFKRGDLVTFKYRELSNDGIPKEARFWRKRND